MSHSPIADMFDRIAPRYDVLNHGLSFNVDKIWRRKTAKQVAQTHPNTILDLATGTADLAITMAHYNPKAHIIGMDISEKMLEIGKTKIKKQNLENQIELQLGNAATLPFEDSNFDAVTIAFGVRNFENLKKGLSEIQRVTKPGGQVIILEFSLPERFPIKQLYHLYFNHILPIIGRLVSKDKAAYSYLPKSVNDFPSPQLFKQLLEEHGLHNTETKRFAFGIATLYLTVKS